MLELPVEAVITELLDKLSNVVTS